MHVRLLGPIEVYGPRGRADLIGDRQRTLVGLLALRAGQVVARSRIVDALWGEDPPRTAVKTLYSHVVRIRQAFDDCGLPGVLTTRDPGYLLDLPADSVDAHRFAGHVRRARVEHGAEAVRELRAGLELWRGDAFADGSPSGWVAADVARLGEVWVTAQEELWTVELSLGRHSAAVAELEHLLSRQPHRERLMELLMLALYRSGRPTDALEAYQRLRSRLVDELGVEPGPALQRLHQAVLRGEAELDLAVPDIVTSRSVPVPVPAQLPRRVGHFAGRTTELAALNELLDGDNDERIVVVSGPAGMGKTALAVHWAHGVRHRFTGGQLFLDLGGHDPTVAMDPADALNHLLRGLGVPADRVPAALPDQIGLYRSLLAGRPVLVLLDNAAGAGQVLPLVPGDDASLVVVTSRHRLAGIATHHAVRLVGLDVLHREEALALLGDVLGADRVAAEANAAGRIVELCGRMPLALRIAVAKLRANPTQRIGDLAAELAEQDRLETLAVEDDPRSMRTVFASAYGALSTPAAAVFRRLGLHPGTTFAGARLAAAVTGETPREADRWIDELTAAHLISDVGGGRHAFHDLIRLYARDRCLVDDGHAEREEAIARLLDWYLAVAAAANGTLDRGRNRVSPELRHRPAELPFTDDRDATLAFLDTERDNMVAVVRWATEQGHDTAAWHLTYLLAAYFEFRGHWADRVEICRWGLAAARRVGDPFAQGLMCSSLGVACCEVRRFDEALVHLRDALAFSRISGDRRGQGTAHNNIAVALKGLGRLPEAIEAYGQALAVHTANDHRLGIALALNNFGDAYALMGETQASLDHLGRALTIIREVGSDRIEALILDNIGQTHLRAGDVAPALAHLDQALLARRRIGDRRWEADTLNHLGLAHLKSGAPAAALDCLTEAVAISRDIADPHLEAVALNLLGQAHLAGGNLDVARELLSLAVALRARVPDPDEEAHLRRNLDELARGQQSSSMTVTDTSKLPTAEATTMEKSSSPSQAASSTSATVTSIDLAPTGMPTTAPSRGR